MVIVDRCHSVQLKIILSKFVVLSELVQTEGFSLCDHALCITVASEHALMFFPQHLLIALSFKPPTVLIPLLLLF